MNQKKKTKTLLILISVIIFVIILIGVGILVLATDTFKSEKELFFKYAANIGDSKSGIIDDELRQYFEKKNNTPYNDEGEFSVNISSDKEQEQFKDVNNFNISFSGQVDVANSKSVQNISLNYSKNVKFPINYKQIGNKIGVQTEYVGSKFVSIDTEKANNTFDDTGEAEEYLNSVNKFVKATQVELTEEEKSNMVNTYIGVLDKQLGKEKFSKIKESNMTGYKLSLKGEELKNILVQLLETLKDDQQTLDKLNEYLKIQKNSAKITSSKIDDEIKSINNDSSLNNEEFEITVYQQNKKICKLKIETSKLAVTIEKTLENNKQNIEILFEMKEEQNEKIKLNASFEGVKSLQTIKEDYELELELPQSTENNIQTNTTTQDMTYKYVFSNEINFTNEAQIEEFSDNNSLMLTDYDSEQVSAFLMKLVQRISNVNKQQMEQLGLEENENPITKLIPSFATYLNATNIINQTNMSEVEVNTFNQKFEVYESTNSKGVTVKGLLSTISLNNQSEEINNKIKEINYNGEEYEATEQNIKLIKEEIDKEIENEKNYRVEFEKDQDTGLIYRAVINEK